MTEIVLPWPPAELSPNSRTHWAIKNRAAQLLKHDCWALTKASGAKVEHDDKIPLRMTFRPPSKHRHDMDNCLARCKALLDGVALALGVDDSRFFLMLEIGEPLKGGAVIIKLLSMENHAIDV